MASTQIKYLNKDFTDFKTALVEYAKAYYPTVYNDFTTASPGTMFIDMASYVGDVLSFYLDNQLQETFLDYAKQSNNLYTMAYMLGYTPRVTSAAVVDLDVYQQLPAITVNGQRQPDFSYALTIDAGMQVQSNTNTTTAFYVPEKIDFSLSSSQDQTEINVYATDAVDVPTSYILRKTVKAISGQVITTTFSFGAATRFPIVSINESSIIEVLNVTDNSTGERWYEVPYLAQNYILEAVTNTAANYPDLYQQSYQVPYLLKKTIVNNRFTTRFKSPSILQLEFGAGVNQVASNILLPDPFNVGMGTINGRTLLNTAFDPTNFVTTNDYGIAPSNTTLTVQYLVGGGAVSNVQSNELTVITNINSYYKQANNNSILEDLYKASVATNNQLPATGGGDGDTTEDLRLNTLAQFPAQLRAVTQQDYLGFVKSMPAKFGNVAKAYVTKDDIIFSKYQSNEPGEKDPLSTSIYLLTYNRNGQLDYPSQALYRNIQTYLNDYRMMTDAIRLKPAYIINVTVDFDIVMRPNYATRETLAMCITKLKDYFDIDKWQINQPIVLGDLYTLLDQVEGVQTVQSVKIGNIAGESKGYSKYSYDTSGATLKNIIYPSLDPSIFEVRYPDVDIQGRVVTL